MTRSTYALIEAYGVVGNLETCALIAPDESIKASTVADRQVGWRSPFRGCSKGFPAGYYLTIHSAYG